jgi:hypothetical protein
MGVHGQAVRSTTTRASGVARGVRYRAVLTRSDLSHTIGTWLEVMGVEGVVGTVEAAMAVVGMVEGVERGRVVVEMAAGTSAMA